MKIFSNFDTKFLDVVLENKTKSFPKEDIFVIRRSWYYLIFRVVFHFLGYLFILFSWLWFLSYVQAMTSIFVALVAVWGIVVWFRVFHKLLKYLYDFTIVTPHGISTYKQKGILQSSIKEIPTRRIKAIEISRTTLGGNIFRYGNVDIIADLAEKSHLGADNEDSWVIGLTYVDQPYKVKERISATCFQG